MKNGYPQLAALDGAIDNKIEAYKWLKNHHFNFLMVFADACREKHEALAWLKKNNLDIFIMLAFKVKSFRDGQTYDYHKMHF